MGRLKLKIKRAFDWFMKDDKEYRMKKIKEIKVKREQWAERRKEINDKMDDKFDKWIKKLEMNKTLKTIQDFCKKLLKPLCITTFIFILAHLFTYLGIPGLIMSFILVIVGVRFIYRKVREIIEKIKSN